MNWTIVGVDDLRAEVSAEAVDGAPATFVAEAITGSVAAVRGAVAAGNALDPDPTTVPGSLRALTARLAGFLVLERLRLGLTPEQRDARKVDVARLVSLREERLRVEPAGIGGVVTVAPGNSGHGREELRGI